MPDDATTPPDSPSAPAPEAVPAAPVLELPAAPRELRPSPHELRPSPHVLDRVELHEALDEFTERAREGVGALATTTSAVAARASETVGDATVEAVAHVRREGAWRTVFRVVGVVATLVLCLRLAFDDALPRIVLGACGAALGLAAVAIVAHVWSVARRRRSLLDALDLLTRVGNANPAALPMLAPQIASLVESLRADDALLRALTAPGNSAPGARRSD